MASASSIFRRQNAPHLHHPISAAIGASSTGARKHLSRFAILLAMGAAFAVYLTSTMFGPANGTRTLSATACQSLAVSPDGETVAVGRRRSPSGHRVELWSVKENRMLFGLDGHVREVYSVAFSPDGELLATGGDDHSVRIWDFKTRKCLKVLNAHESPVRTLAFSPNGSLLATGGADQKLILWRIEDFTLLREAIPVDEDILTLSFASSGELLAIGTTNGLVCQFHVPSLKEERKFAGHTGDVTSVAYSPDGSSLSSVGTDNTLRTWNCSNPATSVSRDIPDGAASVSYTSDGKYVLVGNRESSFQAFRPFEKHSITRISLPRDCIIANDIRLLPIPIQGTQAVVLGRRSIYIAHIPDLDRSAQ